MDSQFSPRIKDIIAYSREEAIRLGNDYIGPEHLFLGILRDGEGLATEVLEALGVDLLGLKKNLEKKLRGNRKIDLDADVAMSKSAEKALKVIYLEARAFKSAVVNTGHLLLAIMKDNDNLIATMLGDSGVNYYMVKSKMQDYKQPKAKSDFPGEEPEDSVDSFSRKTPQGGQ
jgi:ATP-dependent Clp protease ATP-binding subunit ClpC